MIYTQTFPVTQVMTSGPFWNWKKKKFALQYFLLCFDTLIHVIFDFKLNFIYLFLHLFKPNSFLYFFIFYFIYIYIYLFIFL